MSKVTGILLLIIANVVLLVHAVVPHHHHHHSACFINVAEQNETCSHQHTSEPDKDYSHEDNCCDNHEEKDCEEEKGSCLLKDILAITPASHKHESSFAFLVNDNLNSYQVLPVFNANETEGTVRLYGLPFRQNQSIQTYQIIYVSHVLGLRAPPSV